MKKTLKQNYIDSCNYLRKSKKFIVLIALIFLIFVLIGVVFPAPDSITQKILQFLEEILEKTQEMNFIELFWFIFSNNIKVTFIGLISGIFFGILPLLTSIANGYLLGFVSSLVIIEENFLSLWRILPHGIFELPAVFISLGLGLKLGMFIFQKKKIKYLKKNLYNSLKVFFLIILPLLLVAAIIESLFIFLIS
jgi:stage II sporulation protein M